MGIQRLKPSGGTDWSKFVPFNKEFVYSPPFTNAYVTVFGVNGSGYLSKLLGRSVGSDKKIRVKIDGVVTLVFSVEAPGNPYGYCGILRPMDLYPVSGASRMGTREADGTNRELQSSYASNEYPYTDGGKLLCVIPEPIFFKKSLFVEFNTGGTLQNVNLLISGGIG